ncbi:hypothetical protein Bbelb_297680 [Branchiostoma belcheri]|nr:hypothetical protein Bbelb_297680 [Branchiostoma belcheri]
MYAQNRRNVRSPGGVYAQTAAVRSVPISEECTLKTGGTSAHLEECTLKPPTEGRRFRRNVRSKPEERPLTWRSVRSNRRREKCADFGGMYAQNRRNVRSPGGVAPISEECKLKTGGTPAHLEECTLKPPPAMRSAPISEECTLKTGGTSAHLEECTLKPPTEVRRFRRNVRSKPEERPLTWRSVRSNRRREKCADFGGMSVRSNRRLRSAPISEECTLKTGGTSAHLEECTLKLPPEKCADFGGMYAQNRRNVRSPGGVYAQTAAVRSVPISEECTLKTGGTSAHLEDCTLKPPPERCADFGGMYAQNRRNVRSPGGVAPISEECTLKTGGTSAHLEECTLKPPTEVCRFRRNVRSKPEERPLTWRSVRSNRRLRSAPISEECTLKTGGTSAHLEDCTLKPPTEVRRFRRNVRSKPEERPLTWRSVRSNRRREKCADFGGMYAQNRRNVRSPAGVVPISEECTLKTGGTSAHLQECTLKPPPEECADFGGMYAQNRRNVRSPGGVSAPISEECTLKTGGTSAHLEECTLKPPTEVRRFRRNVRSKPEERPLTWRSVRSNRRLKCADFGGMYAQNRRNVRSPAGVNVRSKPEERPLTWRSVRSNRRLRSAPISEECTLKTGGTSAHLEDCTLKPPPEKCADFGGMYAQNRRNVRSPAGVAPISEECTLKTGGTSAHLEECTLKPPTEVCRFRRNVRSKPEERPLTCRSVRSNRRLKCADFGGMYAQNRRNVRSPGGVAPISEECTLKTGGTSAHLEECTLKPPTEVRRFRRNVRSKPEERPLTWRSVRSNRRLKCADFGGMYAQNQRNVRSPGGVAPISEECTLKTGGTSAHLEECTLKPPTEVCRFWRNVRSKPEERPLTWRSVRSNRRLRSAPISEECTLKTGGTSAHLQECTLKPPPEKCADFGGMYAQNRRNVRSPAGVNVRSKPEERPLTCRSVRSNRRLRSAPISEECTLKTGGTPAHLEECTLKPPPEKCADFGGMYAQNRRNVRSPGGLYAQTAD